jgi:hypothetical protein
MSINIDLLTVVVGVICFIAGHSVAVRQQPPEVTDSDLKKNLDYHRNLTDSLRQDVADLRKRNNDLLEKNWQLTQTKPK